MRFRVSGGLMLAAILGLFSLTSFSGEDTGNRVTILYDAFGKTPSMTKAWGFSALVEYPTRVEQEIRVRVAFVSPVIRQLRASTLRCSCIRCALTDFHQAGKMEFTRSNVDWVAFPLRFLVPEVPLFAVSA
jgi:hypothetical protein